LKRQLTSPPPSSKLDLIIMDKVKLLCFLHFDIFAILAYIDLLFRFFRFFGLHAARPPLCKEQPFPLSLFGLGGPQVPLSPKLESNTRCGRLNEGFPALLHYLFCTLVYHDWQLQPPDSRILASAFNHRSQFPCPFSSQCLVFAVPARPHRLVLDNPRLVGGVWDV